MLVQDRSALPDLQALVGALRDAVVRFDPDYLSPEEATSLLKCFAEGERLCAAARTFLLGRLSVRGPGRPQDTEAPRTG
jgi:hypothetical protein